MPDIFNMTDTWNDGGTTFTAIKMDVTDTASAAASKLIDLLVGSVSKFQVDKNGNIDVVGTIVDHIIGTDIQAYSAILAATTASFLTADETKLDEIAEGAQVNVATNLSDTISGSGYSINSSTGNNVALNLADTNNWGLMSDEMFDTLAGALARSGGTMTGELVVEETRDTQYSLTGTVIDPANGNIQYKTLSANTTFTESLVDGQTVALYIDDGAARTITWPTITWLTADGSAPTLATTGYNVIVLQQINGTLYGKDVKVG